MKRVQSQRRSSQIEEEDLAWLSDLKSQWIVGSKRSGWLVKAMDMLIQEMATRSCSDQQSRQSSQLEEAASSLVGDGAMWLGVEMTVK